MADMGPFWMSVSGPYAVILDASLRSVSRILVSSGRVGAWNWRPEGLHVGHVWLHFFVQWSRLEVYIGSDINGQPDPTKYPTNPNTTRYPNCENRTTRTRPDSELPNPNRPDTKWVTKFPGPQKNFTRRMIPFYNLNFTILILQSYTDCRKSLHVQ